MQFFSCIFMLLTLSWQVNSETVWKWECVENNCLKVRTTGVENENIFSLSECRLFCDKYASLWPRPTGNIVVEKFLRAINPHKIFIQSKCDDCASTRYVRKSGERFIHNLHRMLPNSNNHKKGRHLIVTLDIKKPDYIKLQLDTDESYVLTIGETAAQTINATIVAKNFYGARHGLETLGQLIIYDDIYDMLQIPRNVEITDAPSYPYRGILLDTARNYISVDTIKRTLDAMANSKLNTFHWHMTDTQSFPFVSRSHPHMTKLGAYSPAKVYTPENIREIVDFARVRGIRVLPEFDAPAHVGEGWQDTDYLVCFNSQPWGSTCVEPPCGQLDPTKPELYDTLEGIYGDMIELFDPDMFHMGGDEVSLSCWNSTESIVEWMSKPKRNWGREESDFIKLWNVFQSNAKDRLQKKAGRKLPIIMWTSTLTKKDYVDKYLPKDDYIIQIWTSGSDPVIKELLNKGYKLIMSNYDALYLDCGFEGWVTNGNNWCSPYIGWQTVYENAPGQFAEAENKMQILGSEAALWTEQVDDTTIDSRLWPRAAAMAETLWTNPSEGWQAAENRMLIHRERLVESGVRASGMQPEWCLQHQGDCPISKY